MNEILNLTQHMVTESQIKDGVIEPTEKDKQIIKELLTFDEIPKVSELVSRAKKLSIIAVSYGVDKVMIGGAPYLMTYLEQELLSNDMKFVYSFSKRISKEVEKDGKVTKVNVFEHIGFVEIV